MTKQVDINGKRYQVTKDHKETGWEVKAVLKSGKLSKVTSYLYPDGRNYTFFHKAYAMPQLLDDLHVAWLA